MGRQFDLGICLYDVIGSYVDEAKNREILANLVRHIRPGGSVFISVMNMGLTERIAKYKFSVKENPDHLLSLTPSNIMETTGNVFNPDFYAIDTDTGVVYRKEQFKTGRELPEELLVRDRRYDTTKIESSCRAAGLEVMWSRLVRAGQWENPLDESSDYAKEILVFCKMPSLPEVQQSLFQPFQDNL